MHLVTKKKKQPAQGGLAPVAPHSARSPVINLIPIDRSSNGTKAQPQTALLRLPKQSSQSKALRNKNNSVVGSIEMDKKGSPAIRRPVQKAPDKSIKLKEPEQLPKPALKSNAIHIGAAKQSRQKVVSVANVKAAERKPQLKNNSRVSAKSLSKRGSPEKGAKSVSSKKKANGKDKARQKSRVKGDARSLSASKKKATASQVIKNKSKLKLEHSQIKSIKSVSSAKKKLQAKGGAKVRNSSVEKGKKAASPARKAGGSRNKSIASNLHNSIKSIKTVSSKKKQGKAKQVAKKQGANKRGQQKSIASSGKKKGRIANRSSAKKGKLDKSIASIKGKGKLQKSIGSIKGKGKLQNKSIASIKGKGKLQNKSIGSIKDKGKKGKPLDKSIDSIKGKGKGKAPKKQEKVVKGKDIDRSMSSIKGKTKDVRKSDSLNRADLKGLQVRRKSSISEDRHNRKSKRKDQKTVSSRQSDLGRGARPVKVVNIRKVGKDGGPKDRKADEKRKSSSSPDSFALPKVGEQQPIVKPEKDRLVFETMDLNKGQDLLGVCDMIMGDHDGAYISAIFPQIPASNKVQARGVINHSFIKSDFSAERQAYILTPKKLVQLLSRLPKTVQIPKGTQIFNVKLMIETKSKMRMLAGLLQYSILNKQITINRLMVAKMFRRVGYGPYFFLSGVREALQRSKGDKARVIVGDGLTKQNELAKRLGMKSEKVGSWVMQRDDLLAAIAKRIK